MTLFLWNTTALLLAIVGCNNDVVSVMAMTTSSTSSRRSMWKILQTQEPSQAFRTIFGPNGERGEYMDGYSVASMAERCRDDYQWTTTTTDDETTKERASMMSHLYDCETLWKHVNMVAFAEHYVPTETGTATQLLSKPFEIFQRQKSLRPKDEPIFSGVVFADWENYSCEQQDNNNMAEKLKHFSERGIDYVRLECNLGSVEQMGEPSKLTKNKEILDRFDHLARAAQECQQQELVPVVLLQVPWREPDISLAYFEQACISFSNAIKTKGVDPRKLIFETRPPMAMSAQTEKALSGPERIALGLDTGKKMFEVFAHIPSKPPFAGYCVAGGSTKGAFPTAMQDDTQNAVRQGLRDSSKEQWGYEFCFWEMGAKLMLQPQVGKLWGDGQRDAARELFCANAKDMADEIIRPIHRI